MADDQIEEPTNIDEDANLEVAEEEQPEEPIDPAVFLREHHPQVFQIRPRRGRRSSDLQKASAKSDAKREPTFSDLGIRCPIVTSSEEPASRRYRLDRLLKEVIYATPPNEDRVVDRGGKMLAAAISCIMLMARKAPDVPEELVEYTTKYLGGVTDHFGKHPPNVQNILNFISNGLVGDPEVEEPEENTVQTVMRVSLTE